MNKVIAFILLTVFAVSVFAKDLVFTCENTLKNVTFVNNSSVSNIIKTQYFDIEEDYTKFFIDKGIFDFPNSITGERVSFFNDFLFCFQCGSRPRKESQIMLFDSKFKSILVKTIKPGQGPFNLDYIGNCFFINEHNVALIYTYKIIAFDFGNGDFKEYFSQRLPVYNLTYTSAKMLNWGNKLVLFNFSFKPYNNKIPWFFTFDISGKSVNLANTVFLDKVNLKKIAGDVWELNNSKIDKSSAKYYELWPKPTDIKVLKGEKKGDYYFYNPASGIFLKGNCENNKINCYTTFKVNGDVTISDIVFNKYTNEVWIISNFREGNPKIFVLSKNLKYKYTVAIYPKTDFQRVNIYKLIMLNSKKAIAICFTERKGTKAFSYNIVKVRFKNL